MNTDKKDANQKSPCRHVFVVELLSLQNMEFVLDLLKDKHNGLDLSSSLRACVAHSTIYVHVVYFKTIYTRPPFPTSFEWYGRQRTVSHSRTREPSSPLSHLGSPGVGLREERRLKAGLDEKRGCHRIVARLAHPLMELCWGRAP